MRGTQQSDSQGEQECACPWALALLAQLTCQGCRAGQHQEWADSH